MNCQKFEALNGLTLLIKSRKSAVIFEIEEERNNKDYHFSFKFKPEDFSALLHYIEEVSNKSWANLEPKEADSLGSDYFEYYDRPLDNNGYLRFKENEISIERPSLESGRLYQFNKRKMQSFIYDVKKSLCSSNTTKV